MLMLFTESEVDILCAKTSAYGALNFIYTLHWLKLVGLFIRLYLKHVSTHNTKLKKYNSWLLSVAYLNSIYKSIGYLNKFYFIDYSRKTYLVEIQVQLFFC